MNELGNYLKELRNKKSKSLREASKEIGISHTYLDSLEKGFDPRTKKERKPTPETLKKLAWYYEVPYIVLMSKAGYVNKNGAVEVSTLAEALGIDYLTYGDDVINVYEKLEKNNTREIPVTVFIQEFVNITDKKDGAESQYAMTTENLFDLYYLFHTDKEIKYKDSVLTENDKKDILKFIENFIMKKEGD